MTAEDIGISFHGLGTVGQATYSRLIENNMGDMVKAVMVRDQTKKRAIDTSEINFVDNEFIHDPSIDIVVELIGGTGVAKELVFKALRHGKRVVTANKDLVATYMKELSEFSDKLYFDGAVLAGIPIIDDLDAKYFGKVDSLAGILNGVSNLILTHKELGKPIEEAKQIAINRGLAESDISNDINGIDSAYKLSILVAKAFGHYIKPSEISTRGILEVDDIDLEFARQLNYKIKLLGMAKKVTKDDENSLELRVEPTLIPIYHDLAYINYEKNGLTLSGPKMGEVTPKGYGAGGDPTSFSVFNDIEQAIRDIKSGVSNKKPLPSSDERIYVKDQSETVSAYYLRVKSVDMPGALAYITNMLRMADINIGKILQDDPFEDAGKATDDAFILRETEHEKVMKAIREITNEKNLVVGTPKYFRICELVTKEGLAANNIL